MDRASINRKYKDCVDHHWKLPNITITDEEQSKFESNALPLMEKNIFEYKFMKQHSLIINKKLSCHWEMFKERHSRGERNRLIYTMPKTKEMYFHNHQIKFDPTIGSRKDFRLKMRLGPGYDNLGQIPIEQSIRFRPNSAKRPFVLKRKIGK